MCLSCGRRDTDIVARASLPQGGGRRGSVTRQSYRQGCCFDDQILQSQIEDLFVRRCARRVEIEHWERLTYSYNFRFVSYFIALFFSFLR